MVKLVVNTSWSSSHTCNRAKSVSNHMHELSDVVAFVKGAAHVEAPNDFTLSVMSRLPKEKSHAGVSRWFRQHPVLTAAAIVLFVNE